MTLEDRWRAVAGKPAGFDYLRIALSTAVVAWHAYQMSYGTDEALRFWARSPVGSLLALILPVFFALSGFLVAGSMVRNPDLRVFLSLRAIRIYPALVVEVALAAFILGPIVTTVPLTQYFGSVTFYKYLLNTIGYIHYQLPGVFLSNPTPGIVNSQLWTVPYELECYVLISVLALIGMFSDRRRVLPLFVVATAVVTSFNAWRGLDALPAGGMHGRVLVLCFFAGIVVHAYRDRLPWNRLAAAVAAVICLALTKAPGQLPALMPIFAAYLTTYLGMLNPKRTMIVTSGDYSYGLYLYSGPIQQTVALHLGAGATMLRNFAISLPIGILFALFSWWCVEKPFMKVRRLVQPRRAPPVTNAVGDGPLAPPSLAPEQGLAVVGSMHTTATAGSAMTAER